MYVRRLSVIIMTFKWQ